MAQASTTSASRRHQELQRAQDAPVRRRIAGHSQRGRHRAHGQPLAAAAPTGRPLDAVWPVVFIDALMVKIRDGVVASRPVFLAVGVDCDGAKQILGLWVGPTTGESAKFWLTVLSGLKSQPPRSLTQTIGRSHWDSGSL
jgi:hypothetical protein